MTGADVLVFSNGNGEDEIACLILDALTPAERGRVAAWPMVGNGKRYEREGVRTFGPANALPSEGFGTVSLNAFLKDIRAGFLGTYLAQARHARSLRGSASAILAIGDIVPLAAAWLTGLPTLFLSSAKSARYGGTDGHNAAERALMRRTARVLVRDARTARMLQATGVDARFLGNPMMDGVAGATGHALRRKGRVNVALIPGTRADATENARLLLEGIAAAGEAFHGILAAAPGFDADHRLASLQGWTSAEAQLSHPSGATAEIATGRFAEALAAADLAVGMAGTGNEQAVGLGLPLVAVPGAGNQGAAFARMKQRYFGRAALPAAPTAKAIADALKRLADDPELRTRMADEGRTLMGPSGASAAIATELRRLAGWETAHG